MSPLPFRLVCEGAVQELREESASSCNCERSTQLVSESGPRGTPPPLLPHIVRQANPTEAEAKEQSQWLRKVPEGQTTPPVDPEGQTPALSWTPRSPDIDFICSLQTKEASYADSESYQSF